MIEFQYNYYINDYIIGAGRSPAFCMYFLEDETMIVAIDGPAGAGKSTVAKQLARKLGYIYIDTGAMYRALTYKAVQTSVHFEDGQELANLLKKYPVQLTVSENEQRIVIGDHDVTEHIRTPEISKFVSIVAAHKQVRDEMLKIQRKMAKQGNVVMDGRDIGTNVLPDAELKIFLTASIETRAQRRYQELLQKGFQGSVEEIKEDIFLRDKQDQEREVAPLKKANDAILVDTSNLTIEEVVHLILNLVNEVKTGE